MVRSRKVQNTKIKNTINEKSKIDTTFQLRRSERIKNKQIKIKTENRREMGISILKTDKKVKRMNKRQIRVIKKQESNRVKNNTQTFIKNASHVNFSNSGDIKEKFYNEIARDEVFRDKVDSNPIAFNKDKYGNLAGNEYDLAMDKAFDGFLIAVLQLYKERKFDFENPKSAFEEKGFKLHRWTELPKIKEFKDVLTRSCQLWVISSAYDVLTAEYLEMIKNFFDCGKGVYIWGDNAPYYVDANKLAKYLFNAEMGGMSYGCQVVKLQNQNQKCGLVGNHIINTGLDFLYEGHTVAIIKDNPDLEPVMYGSDNNLIVAAYNKNGKRAIIDGGFTRLYLEWDTAGTGRYVKNAAAWLANVENIPI